MAVMLHAEIQAIVAAEGVAELFSQLYSMLFVITATPDASVKCIQQLIEMVTLLHEQGEGRKEA